MTVKKILGECLLKMGLKDFSDKTSYSESENEILVPLLGALNIAYRTAVCEYLPLIAQENVIFENGSLKSSALQKKILYPIRLIKDGNKVEFKTYPSRIAADISGEATLEYAYMPADPLTLNGTVNDMRLTQSALSDGALAEYYFANKVFDLAKNFDTAFRSKLSVLRNKGKSLRLKERRWYA